MSINAKLLQAYLDSHYEMALPTGHCILQIGQHSDALDAFLKTEQCSEACFLTAHNPGSRLLPAAINHSRHCALAALLQARRLRHIGGVGRNTPAMQSWPAESGFLILDCPSELGRSLGHLFGQHAILHVEFAAPVQLLWCET